MENKVDLDTVIDDFGYKMPRVWLNEAYNEE
jgi:hypothetical protein